MSKGYADYYLGFGFILFLRVKQTHACSQNWGLPSLSQLSKGAMNSFYSPRGDPCIYKHGNHSCLGSYLLRWAFYRNQVRHNIECPSSCSPIRQPVSEITAY